MVENRGDMFRQFSAGDDPGGLFSNVVYVDEFGRESGEEGIAVVDARSDK